MPSSAPAASDQRTAFYKRLFSTVSLWIVMGIAMYAGHLPTVLGIATLLGIGGAVEYAGVFSSTDATGSRRHAWLVVVASIAWWACVWLQPVGNVPAWLDFAVLFASIQVAFLLCYNIEVAREGALVLRRVFSSVFGVFYTVVLYGYLVRIILLGSATPGGEHGIPLVLFVIMVTKFADMGAYAIGSWVGSDHYMCPKISPKKTWEGLGGAFLGGFVASSALLGLKLEAFTPVTWAHTLWLVPVLVLLAVTGDLAESILKRCLQVKDAGHKLPGIGGVLDLTDSLLYTAPAFYTYLMWGH